MNKYAEECVFDPDNFRYVYGEANYKELWILTSLVSKGLHFFG